MRRVRDLRHGAAPAPGAAWLRAGEGAPAGVCL